MTNKEKSYLRIAVITGAHGLNGRLKVFLISDIISRFEKGKKILLKKNENYNEFKVLEFKQHKGRNYLLLLEKVNDRNLAESLKGIEIFIEKSIAEDTRDQLEEDSFYYFDLIDCKVYHNNKEFGLVKDIIEAGSGNVLVIKTLDGIEHMVPFVESMVDTSFISEKKIKINPVEGLFDF